MGRKTLTPLAILMFFGFVLQSMTIIVAQQNQKQATAKGATSTYQQTILPLLKNNCTPCHFEGGKVYDHYPFDDYEAVKTLGMKLNTRFKKKEQQGIVLNWLKAGAKEK